MIRLWLILTALAAIFAGIVAGHSRSSRPVGYLEKVSLRQAPWMLIAAMTPLALLWSELWLRLHPDWAWNLPFWLQRNFVFLVNDLLVGSYGFLAGFAAAVTLRARPQFGWLAVTLALLAESAILGLGWHNVHEQPVVLDEPCITPEGAILQTSNGSCAPAASANILQCFGVNKSEGELARLFGTQENGTLPGQIVLGFEKLGFVVARKSLDDADINDLTPPALLFLDDDSHVIALLDLNNEQATVVDPEYGLSVVCCWCINKEWTGHALEIKRLPCVEGESKTKAIMGIGTPFVAGWFDWLQDKSGPVSAGEIKVKKF